MSWNLQGTFFENCSCDAICPCTWSNLAHAATRDYCRFAMAFQVDSGDIDGVDVSGRSFVLIGDTPPQMDAGGWKVGVFVDDGASEEQVAKLGEVLTGSLGGPPAALGPLLGEFLGIEQAPITIETDGKRHHVTVGNAVEYSGERVTIEDGSPVTLTNIVVHPAGPVLGVAPVSSSKVSAFGVEYDGTDLSGFSNSFNWAA